MKLKVTYRVRNWKQYNQALRNRGNITVWFTEEALMSPEQKRGRGRPPKYSIAFIRLALAVRYLFRLPLRATQGLMDGLMQQQGLSKVCCDYTLLSKRAPEVEEEIKRLTREIPYAAHIAIDSTGLKVYGEGEWKARVHGVSKRRTWRKLHLAIDLRTHEIIGVVLTDKDVSDGSALPKVLKNVKKIGEAALDGAYDQNRCYETIESKGGTPIIPPREGSNPPEIVKSRAQSLRMLNVQGCALMGRKSWKVGTGYHRRSLVETAMGRWKTTFGGKLKSRSFRNQKAEAAIKADILNQFTRLGMPKTETIKKWVR